MMFSGKVVAITGAAGGIGQALCRRFAAEGADVVGCDIDPQGAEETLRQVQAQGGNIGFAGTDAGTIALFDDTCGNLIQLLQS